MVIKHLPFTFLPHYLSLPILFPNATVHIFPEETLVQFVTFSMKWALKLYLIQIIYVKKIKWQKL